MIRSPSLVGTIALAALPADPHAAGCRCHDRRCVRARFVAREVAKAQARRTSRRATAEAMRQAIGSLRDVIGGGEPETVPWGELGGD